MPIVTWLKELYLVLNSVYSFRPSQVMPFPCVLCHKQTCTPLHVNFHRNSLSCSYYIYHTAVLDYLFTFCIPLLDFYFLIIFWLCYYSCASFPPFAPLDPALPVPQAVPTLSSVSMGHACTAFGYSVTSVVLYIPMTVR